MIPLCWGKFGKPSLGVAGCQQLGKSCHSRLPGRGSPWAWPNLSLFDLDHSKLCPNLLRLTFHSQLVPLWDKWSNSSGGLWGAWVLNNFCILPSPEPEEWLQWFIAPLRLGKSHPGWALHAQGTARNYILLSFIFMLAGMLWFPEKWGLVCLFVCFGICGFFGKGCWWSAFEWPLIKVSLGYCCKSPPSSWLGFTLQGLSFFSHTQIWQCHLRNTRGCTAEPPGRAQLLLNRAGILGDV